MREKSTTSRPKLHFYFILRLARSHYSSARRVIIVVIICPANPVDCWQSSVGVCSLLLKHKVVSLAYCCFFFLSLFYCIMLYSIELFIYSNIISSFCVLLFSPHWKSMSHCTNCYNTQQFNIEMKNRGLDNVVTAPTVVEELSTTRILTTEWVSGVRLDQSKAGDIPTQFRITNSSNNK